MLMPQTKSKMAQKLNFFTQNQNENNLRSTIEAKIKIEEMMKNESLTETKQIEKPFYSNENKIDELVKINREMTKSEIKVNI